jgi:hypothetical protein
MAATMAVQPALQLQALVRLGLLHCGSLHSFGVGNNSLQMSQNPHKLRDLPLLLHLDDFYACFRFCIIEILHVATFVSHTEQHE